MQMNYSKSWGWVIQQHVFINSFTIKNTVMKKDNKIFYYE